MREAAPLPAFQPPWLDSQIPRLVARLRPGDSRPATSMNRLILLRGIEHLVIGEGERVPSGYEVLSDLEMRWVLGRRGPLPRGTRLVRRARTRLVVHYEPPEQEEVELASFASPVEQLHWIEIELLDKEGAPVASTRCIIEFPSGKTQTAMTDRFGRVRVEDLPKGGDCWVTLPDLDADAWDQGNVKETKIEEEPWHWIELQLVDEEELPVPNLECVVALPDGGTRRLVSDDMGRIWVEGIQSPDDCMISFPALDAEAWEVVDG